MGTVQSYDVVCWLCGGDDDNNDASIAVGFTNDDTSSVFVPAATTAAVVVGPETWSPRGTSTLFVSLFG